ncbi:MAG: hypothetical protein Q9221_001846 [Calogaya cf. arnoldii]
MVVSGDMNTTSPDQSPEKYEEKHVHEVYEQIASHFSSTRYKPWPIVQRFLQELPTGSVGLDVGCGNGKYLTVNPNVFIVASDRRVQAIAAILETLRPASEPEQSRPNPKDEGGKALIYVWALEQKTSRRGWDEGDEQDVMVPWVMKTQSTHANHEITSPSNENSKTFHRYYHLYRQGELEADLAEAGGCVVESGYEKDNWWAIAVRKE